MNVDSKLFQVLSDNELFAIMHAVFGNEEIRRAELLEGGLFNTTYRVETSVHDVVLRMGPVHRELLLPFERNLMEAEAYVDRPCLNYGIPASRVLCCDTSRRVVDRDYMVVEYIDSIPMSDPAIPENALYELSVSCGYWMRRMHAVTGKKFGRVSDILKGMGKDTWGEAVLAEFRRLIETSEKFAVFEPDFIKRAYTFAEEALPLLNRVLVPRLAHADLWKGNVLVKEMQDGQYEVQAIIDGDRAVFGDVAFDLDSPWMVDDAFLKGYGERSEPFSLEEKRQKQKVYRLLFALTDAYVWRIQYCNEENHQHCLAEAKSILAGRI